MHSLVGLADDCHHQTHEEESVSVTTKFMLHAMDIIWLTYVI